jgi:hypothetical protein
LNALYWSGKTSFSLFVSLVYCAESTVRWFVVREKHCWMAADSADKSKRTGRLNIETSTVTSKKDNELDLTYIKAPI